MDAEAAERALAEFRHEAAHPIALMESALRELGRRTDLGDDEHELLEVARRQGAVLGQLLERLRGTGEDELVVEASALDLGDLAVETVGDLRLGILADRDCDVSATDGPVPVRGDAVLLRRALTNLLDNAVKYSPPETSIHVVAERHERTAALWVEDEGDGVAPDDMQEIFDRFERRTDRPGGLGLGLAVVKRVVEAHDGTVEARPAPSGRGTRFVVTLPLDPAAA